MDSMRNQVKTQDTQQLSTPLKQEKSGNKSPEREDHPSNEEKIEEQSKLLGAHQCENGGKYEKSEISHEEIVYEKPMTSSNGDMEKGKMDENGPRERLKRHRREVAGQVWIPDMWGQEDLLKDWIDCSAFDACLVPQGIMLARASLVDEGRRAHSGTLRVENSC